MIWECVKVWLFMIGFFAAAVGAIWFSFIQAPKWAQRLWAYEKQLRRAR
jgi:hypothetical protein